MIANLTIFKLEHVAAQMYDQLKDLERHLDAILNVKESNGSPLSFEPGNIFTDKKCIQEGIVYDELSKKIDKIKCECQIWLNSNSAIGERASQGKPEITIIRTVTFSDKTNGYACPMVVVECMLYQIRFALKFRKVQGTVRITDLSENESKNAIIVDGNENIKTLFPTLYCLVDLKCAYKNKEGTIKREHWEAIGIELLVPVPSISLKEETFYNKCFQVLKSLHTNKFVHGDSHSSNFMFVGEINNNVKMIDFDRVVKLPTLQEAQAQKNTNTQEHLDVAIKHMIITDFVQLLFHGNVHCKIKLETQFYYLFVSSPTLELGYIPRGIGVGRLKDIKLICQFLSVHIKDGTTYYDFIKEKSVEDINSYFEEIFKSSKNLIEFHTRAYTLVAGISEEPETSSSRALYKRKLSTDSGPAYVPNEGIQQDEEDQTGVNPLQQHQAEHEADDHETDDD